MEKYPKLEYKWRDDAWYSVYIIKEEEEEKEEGGWCLKVHYEGFAEEEDEMLRVHDYHNLEDFKTRFRYVSKQLQDQHCTEVKQGMVICASYSSDTDDNKFFDARVQQVCKLKHEFIENDKDSEICTCTFKVLWLAGPCVHKTSCVSCPNICLLSPGSIENHPIVKAFVKLIEESLDGKLQSHGRNPSKRNAVNMKESKIVNAEHRLGEPGKTKNNLVSLSNHGNNYIISAQDGVVKASDICKSNVAIDNLKSRMEAASPSTKEVDGNTFQSISVSSKSSKMEKNVGDRSNAIENIVTGSDVLLQQVVSSFNYLENPVVSGSGMDSQISMPCFSKNESGTNTPKTIDEVSVVADIYCEFDETQLNLVRKEDKLSLDLNSMPVELDTEQLDTPNPAGSLYGRTLTESLLQSSHSHAGTLSSNLNNANIENNNNNSNDKQSLEMDNNMGIIENPRPCNSGWLETEDSDILQNGKNELNTVSKNISGKSFSSSVDIRNKVSLQSEDHSLSAGHMKRPYSCERSGEPLGLKESQKNKEVAGNKLLEKTLLASCWGKGKRQKHTNNETLCSEEPVGNQSNASDDIDALRASGFSASCVKVSKKNDFSESSKGSSVHLHAVNKADIINCETKHGKLKIKEISSQKLPTETVYILSDDEDDFEDSKKTCKIEILDLTRQHDEFVKLQGSSCTTERRKEGCSSERESYKNVQIETEDNSIIRCKCEGQKKAPAIQRHCGGHSISDKCICCSSDYSDAADIPSSFMYCKHNMERCHHLAFKECERMSASYSKVHSKPSELHDRQTSCTTCHQNGTYTGNRFTACCESFSQFSYCQCCKLDKCNVNASSDDESISNGEGTCCFEASNCRHSRKYIKSNVPKKRAKTTIAKGSFERCGFRDSDCGHCGENVGSADRQFHYSEALVIDNLEKDVSTSDLVKVISSMIHNVVQAHILPSLHFEHFTRGFVWFQDHASLMKAFDCLQDDNLFIVSSNGRPWVVHQIDSGSFEGIFGGFHIESKDNKHCCREIPSFSKILFVHKGTQEYEKAKSRKNAFLEFLEHLTILHKRLELDENQCVQNHGSD